MADAKQDELKIQTDAWGNIITGLGTARDKREAGAVKVRATNASFKEFEDLFHHDDMSATIAELPAKEMVREWFEVRTDGDTENSDPQERADTSKATRQKLDDLEAPSRVFEAETWARVFGGSLLFLGIDDGGGSDPKALSKPLNEKSIRTFESLQVFDRWDVSVLKWYDDLRSPKYGMPELYQVVNRGHSGGVASAALPIHETRFIRFDGAMTSRRRWVQNGGWADSVYIRVAEVIRDFGLAWGGTAHLLQDFAQAVFKMRGLKEALASDNDKLVVKRMILMDTCRSIARAVPLDADGEDFDRKQTPVSGLPELLDRFALRVSAAARMPASLLFGQSPAGLNATGESDIRFFYDGIKAQQEHSLKPKMNRLVKLVFLSADGPTKGQEPENWSIEFNPLWQLDEKEQAEVRKLQADTDQVYISNGVLTEDEVAASRFGGDRYSTDTTLDLEKREEQAALDERAAEMEPEEVPAVPIVPAANGAAPPEGNA